MRKIIDLSLGAEERAGLDFALKATRGETREGGIEVETQAERAKVWIGHFIAMLRE